MDHPQTPRILAPHLSNFQHRIVRMLGKVVQLRGETAVIDAGGNVDVILNRVSYLVSSLITIMAEEPKHKHKLICMI
jgi:replication factor A3